MARFKACGWWLGLGFVLLLALPQVASANDCCHTITTGPCVARPNHFLAECKTGQIYDQDCGTVCCIEHILTDPCPGSIPACLPDLSDAACADTDGDGLIDDWELNGFDMNGNGVIDPNENFPAMCANPNRKDLFIESDCLVASDHSHCPSAQALADVIQAFANAPVHNPDGTDGIQLHIDVGPLYGAGANFQVPRPGGGAVGTYGDFGGGNSIPEAGNTIINSSRTNGTDIATLKGTHFDANRSLVFRYLIWGHQTNARAALNDCTSGFSPHIPGTDFIVTLGGTGSSGFPCWFTDANGFSIGSRSQQAGTLMHEFGHTLGLGHGGFEGTNNKPNYLSVMNYSFQGCSVPASGPAGLPGGCDFSRLESPSANLISLNEPSLDECLGIGTGIGFGPMDWNKDGHLAGATGCNPPNTTNVVADVNLDGACILPGMDQLFQTTPTPDDGFGDGIIHDGTDRRCQSIALTDDFQLTAVGQTPAQEDVLRSQNDWNHLLTVAEVLGASGSGEGPPPADEPDPEAIAIARRALSDATQPTVSMSVTAPATVLPGHSVTYHLSVGNVGHGPALGLMLVNTLPDGSQTPFDLGTFVLGGTFSHDFTVQVPADACPRDLVDDLEASWSDLASVHSTGQASASTRVLDEIPPTLSFSLSPSELWPANHKFVPITATITVTDNCDPHPTVKLISIVSSEPDDGQGDGDTAQDIAGAALGTDDRQFQLRAERSGKGKGRVYTVTYEASDASGNKTRRQATVTVPHSR